MNINDINGLVEMTSAEALEFADRLRTAALKVAEREKLMDGAYFYVRVLGTALEVNDNHICERLAIRIGEYL